ncbi:MAG: hypothetical protein OHK0056_28600 [Bacteriovoracaceae bacterium]
MKDSYFKIEKIEIIDKSVIKYSVFEYLPDFDAFIKNKNNINWNTSMGMKIN